MPSPWRNQKEWSIECCRYCVAPKRYPGCHSHCKEYKEQKAENEAKKAKVKAKIEQESPILRSKDFN